RRERVGRRRVLRGLVQLRDAQGRRDLMRDGQEQLLVVAAEGLMARALDAKRADALIPQLQWDDKHGVDLGRAVIPRVLLRIGHVLGEAMLDDPPRDSGAGFEEAAGVGLGWAERGAHNEPLLSLR